MLNILKKLAAIPSVSGHEHALTAFIADYVKPYADEITFDPLGNLIVRKKADSENAKKLMFAAHIDEIGFMVTGVTDKGFVKVTSLGGVNVAAVAYTVVQFDNGVRGVFCPDAGCGMGEWRVDKFVIDIGAKNKKEAEKKVKLGDTAIYAPGFTRLMNNRYAGHAVDDKIGAAIMMKALENMCKAGAKFANDTYFVFTVQEEVGCRGSKTAAFNVAPDYAVAYDVTRTGDSFGAADMEVSLGGGAAIKLRDSSVICDVEFTEFLEKLADDNKIKWQPEILVSGGTDTSSMQMAAGGSKAGAISIPMRYIHTGSEMFDLGDCAEIIKLTEVLLGTAL